MGRTGQGTRDAGGGRTFRLAYHGGTEAVPAPEIRERLNACGGGGRGGDVSDRQFGVLLYAIAADVVKRLCAGGMGMRGGG